MSADEFGGGQYASPPCLASEIAPDYFDPLAVDPQQARDVARWRKSERQRLLAERRALRVEQRSDISATLVERVRQVVVSLASERDLLPRGSDETTRACVVSGYWPIKGEPDLRPLLHHLHNQGFEVALPLVEQNASPLVFRRWTPQTKMVLGDWNIPVPPPDAPVVRPDIALAPVVGWDPQGYRLGYGGGYFDRTLAALDPRPATIGIGFEAARLATIFPQPHDIKLDCIVTESGLRLEAQPLRQ